jgi:hypothetical protein
MEDRFLTLKLMETVSDELEAAGFKHVVARHHFDPEWRAQYRPTLEPVGWTVAITDFLLPLPKIKTLIEICERHSLVVWWGSTDHENGRELYLKLGTSETVARRFITPNS